MKHFSRVLCLLLMLALLLPGALAEAVEQTEQIDSSIEEDEVEKVGDIFDMYQVGSMVEANGKLYTISYGPTICEFDGENWRIAVVASSFSDVLRFSEDGSFYSDETSAVLSVDEDGTLLLLYPYSDGVIDLLRIPLDGSDVTRAHRKHLLRNTAAAVQLELHHILACVRFGRAHDDRHALVNALLSLHNIPVG